MSDRIARRRYLAECDAADRAYDGEIVRERRPTAFKSPVRRFGFSAAIRQARNLGVDFVDCYVAAFGRMPGRI